jgi:hypothetical protein
MWLMHGIGISIRNVFLLTDRLRVELPRGAVLLAAIVITKSPGITTGSGPISTLPTLRIASGGAGKDRLI